MHNWHFLARLTDVLDFVRCQKKFSSVEGWLADMEGYALHVLAAEGQGSGEIVEIGSYVGRSTAFLASGAMSAGREKVTAIDHFKGSPEHQPGKRVQSPLIVKEGTTFNRFMENMTKHGLTDYISPIVASSEEAAKNWSKPIRLLFIDGDHSYEESKKDFELWSPFVIKNGFICLHDINKWPGVTQFYQELIKDTKNYKEVATVVSLKVVQKL